MITVILCGGRGLRYNSDMSNSEISNPKPLAPIGDKAIIHHVMDIYANQGYNDFILSLGYKKEKIIEYFSDIKHNFNIQFVDTGEDSNTGQRIKLIKDYILREGEEKEGEDKDSDNFFCNYSDGLSNVNLSNLLKLHKSNNYIGTLTAVKPNSPYGILHISFGGRVIEFDEKPKMKDYINGGYFCFNTKIFDHITKNNEDLEKDILPRLCYEGKLGAYKHDGYFDTLNSVKDELRLNQLYDECKKNRQKLPWLRE